MVNVKNNLIGKTFGRLLVIEQAEDYINPKGIHYARWKCLCECGNIIYATTGNLSQGNSASCGCLRNEHRAKENKKIRVQNTYDLSGEYGIGYTQKGDEFWFDLEDYDKIKDYCWRYDNQGYVVTTERKTRKRILLHRLIIGEENIPEKYIVDHKQHPHGHEHKIDNRKQNLEIKTTSENMMNAHIYSNTKSGYLGVTYDRNKNMWQSRIGINKQRIHLGWFKNKEDAIKARKDAEIKYYGDKRFDLFN